MSDYWKNRALRAENAVRYVMWTQPHRNEKSAKEFADRVHTHIESRYPDQITRYTHTRVEVFSLAESCDCDLDDPEYDDWHCESDENGEDLCSRTFLGHVCEFCSDEDGDGPSWKPEAVEWPCRVIRDLDSKMGRTDEDA
ncbi:MAG: hypothetical protein IJI97_06665 [Clostridia bacterium]|nr:hypothetical protein [Clostridia bacterium]